MSRGRRRIVRSLSFNSQSFDTAVPGCPRVVRKIPRIVFIAATRKASAVLRSTGLFLSISLSLPPSPPSLTAPPSYRRRFFLALKTGSGARGQWSSPSCDRGVPRENAPIVRDQTAVTARFLRSLRIISRELHFREESSFLPPAPLSRNSPSACSLS